jgi:hypothetical protein
MLYKESTETEFCNLIIEETVRLKNNPMIWEMCENFVVIHPLEALVSS